MKVSDQKKDSASSQVQINSESAWKRLCQCCMVVLGTIGALFVCASVRVTYDKSGQEASFTLGSGTARGIILAIGGVFLGMAALSCAILLGDYLINKFSSKKCSDDPSTNITVNTVEQNSSKSTELVH